MLTVNGLLAVRAVVERDHDLGAGGVEQHRRAVPGRTVARRRAQPPAPSRRVTRAVTYSSVINILISRACRLSAANVQQSTM